MENNRQTALKAAVDLMYGMPPSTIPLPERITSVADELLKWLDKS